MSQQKLKHDKLSAHSSFKSGYVMMELVFGSDIWLQSCLLVFVQPHLALHFDKTCAFKALCVQIPLHVYMLHAL